MTAVTVDRNLGDNAWINRISELQDAERVAKDHMVSQLENEMYAEDKGFVTFAEVAPAGTGPLGDYGPDGFDIVVLDHDGRTVAARHTNDVQDDQWYITNISDLVDAILALRAAYAAQQDAADIASDDEAEAMWNM